MNKCHSKTSENPPGGPKEHTSVHFSLRKGLYRGWGTLAGWVGCLSLALGVWRNHYAFYSFQSLLHTAWRKVRVTFRLALKSTSSLNVIFWTSACHSYTSRDVSISCWRQWTHLHGVRHPVDSVFRPLTVVFSPVEMKLSYNVLVWKTAIADNGSFVHEVYLD